MFLSSLCVLFSLLFLGVQEPSNPPPPSGGINRKSVQNKSSENEREGEPSKPSRRGSADIESPDHPTNDGVAFPEMDDRQKSNNSSDPNFSMKLDIDTVLGIGLLMATFGLVYFTWKQAKVAKNLFSIQSQLFSIQSEKFRADHRPVFELRNIVLDREEIILHESLPENSRKLAPSDIENMIKGETEDGYFEVANTGGLGGEPIRAYMCCRVDYREELAVIAPPWKKVREREISVGQTFRVNFIPEPDRELNRSLLPNVFDGTCRIYLLGAIQYLDWRKGARTTAFCRRYNMVTNEFERLGNPQYEYQE